MACQDAAIVCGAVLANVGGFAIAFVTSDGMILVKMNSRAVWAALCYDHGTHNYSHQRTPTTHTNHAITACYHHVTYFVPQSSSSSSGMLYMPDDDDEDWGTKYVTWW